MRRPRIQVYTDAETKRRIELAAAKQQTSVTEYCLAAIAQQLADDDLLEEAAVAISIKPPAGNAQITSGLLAQLRQLREAIQADRGGEALDLDTLLEALRDERDHELVGMR
jgi:hypothetical protein